MKVHRFIGPFSLVPGPFFLTDQEVIHQICDVLKLRPEEEIILCDGRGIEALGKITGRDEKGIQLALGEITPNKAEPGHQVALYCSVLKKENFELVCQKATEAGVTEIIPVITERTVKQGLRPERLEKIIREAAEQSGRGVLPRLAEAMDFEKGLTDSARFGARCLCDPGGQSWGSSQGKDVAVFIGPEGGWSENEIELAKKAGLSAVSFGQRILRGETAAIIATFLAAM